MKHASVYVLVILLAVTLLALAVVWSKLDQWGVQ